MKIAALVHYLSLYAMIELPYPSLSATSSVIVLDERRTTSRYDPSQWRSERLPLADASDFSV
jgi:hypothetical protein